MTKTIEPAKRTPPLCVTCRNNESELTERGKPRLYCFYGVYGWPAKKECGLYEKKGNA